MRAAYAIGLLVCVAWQVCADDDIITEPRPGDEYVIVSSGQQSQLRNFESSHKIPEKHPHHRLLKSDDSDKAIHKLHKGKVARHISEGIIAIEEDKRINYDRVSNKAKIAESIEIDVPYSKLEEIKIKENLRNIETNSNLNVALEAMSESGKLLDSTGTTTQKPILTTAAASSNAFDYIPINIDNNDDINSGLFTSNINLETAGTAKKQHSRIQVKKGPNGQDYEYEYVYYYYYDDEGTDNSSVHNAHDGPQKSAKENQIIKDTTKNKYNAIDRTSATTYAPSSAATEVHNEITPGRGRHRGRTLDPAPVQEEITSDRLPSSTRFPPRSQNLASSTTNAPEASTEQRPRSRSDSNSDDAHPRPRTRSHIRQPSSKLVDLDSFNTHSGGPSNQYKEPPPRYIATSKTTTETYDSTTARNLESERVGHSLAAGSRHQAILDDSKTTADYKTTTFYEHETTEYTTMTAMEKVALELYAYLAGENLNNDVSPTQSDVAAADETTTFADDSSTTEFLSTTTQEATTTTTTTTTTPAPTTPSTTTTTTTAAPSTRASRFKLRSGARGRITPSTSTTEPTQLETSTKAKARFERLRPGTARQGSRITSASSTTAPAAGDQGEEQPPANVKPLGTRRGLFANRRTPSPTTSALPNTSPTSATVDGVVNGSDNFAVTRSSIRGRPNIHSLRPGLRPNLRSGARLAAITPPTTVIVTETEAPVQPSSSSQPSAVENDGAEAGPSSAPPDVPRPGLRMRNRIVPSPRPHVSTAAPARRPNPLLKRRLTTKAAAVAAKKTRDSEDFESSSNSSSDESEPTTSATASSDDDDATPAPQASPPPRGLEALFARRRLNRQSTQSKKQ